MKTLHFNAHNIAGLRFGSLTAIEHAGSRRRHRTMWKCRCDCGTEVDVALDNLRSGNTQSCGCLRGTHKQSESPEYKIWTAMKDRCFNPKNKRFKDYGGRGIQVCQQWIDSFEQFIHDMGFRPSSEHSLDRYPNQSGNYEPGNCRWATRQQQQRNMRSNRALTYMGETKSLIEWCEQLGIRPNTVACRLHRGWSVERALGKK